jgi:hypothetical protein
MINLLSVMVLSGFAMVASASRLRLAFDLIGERWGAL